MEPNAYGLFYFDPTSPASWVVRAETWLVNRPRPKWRAIPSHAAFALPDGKGTLTRYQAIATGIERRPNYTIKEMEQDPLWIATEPVYLPDLEKAMRYADWMAGGRYAWSEIAEIFADDLLPAFMQIMGRHPGEAICSELDRAILVVGGRCFAAPHLSCTPYDIQLVMRRLEKDRKKTSRAEASTLSHKERGGLVSSLQEAG